MRFLADESCDLGVVRALRTKGHDVLAVAEIFPRADDSEVIRLGLEQKRILLTEDKDFGQLVHAHGQRTLGVIFLRYPSSARQQIAKDVVRLVSQRAEGLAGSWVVVQPGKIRIGRGVPAG